MVKYKEVTTKLSNFTNELNKQDGLGYKFVQEIQRWKSLESLPDARGNTYGGDEMVKILFEKI